MTAVARVALAERIETLPVALLDEASREMRPLVDRRLSLVRQRT